MELSRFYFNDSGNTIFFMDNHQLPPSPPNSDVPNPQFDLQVNLFSGSYIIFVIERDTGMLGIQYQVVIIK